MVKEAVFSMIAERVAGALVLDAFAGTGAFGIEALSRGAKSAVFIEKSREASFFLEKNLENTGLTAQARLFTSELPRFLERNDFEPFDVIFADPPYNSGLLLPFLEIIAEKRLLSGIMVVKREKMPEPPLHVSLGFHLIKTKRYRATEIDLLTAKNPPK
jgi:16S rRNA (guanine966-N2)-methyltransferase